MFRHRVVTSSGGSTFLAKITHDYGFQNVEQKLIKIDKIDKNSKIKTGRLPVVAVYATVVVLLLSLFSEDSVRTEHAQPSCFYLAVLISFINFNSLLLVTFLCHNCV
jgi:hypothetical protein